MKLLKNWLKRRRIKRLNDYLDYIGLDHKMYYNENEELIIKEAHLRQKEIQELKYLGNLRQPQLDALDITIVELSNK
tara:strand:- start:74384 stop:74614 length:231 start_codon:yes stop_codon:yes gene_type:complete